MHTNKLFENSFFVLMVLLSVVILSSCSDDDPEPNRIVIDGNGLTLDKGYIIEDSGTSTDDDGEEGRIYTIILFGPGIDYEVDEDLVGEGDAVVLTLFSPSTSELQDGTYTVNEDELVGAFFAQVFENYVADDDDAEVEYQSNGGSITVTKSGDKYTIKFDFRVIFEDGDGNLDAADARGQYSGTLTPLED